MRGRRIEENSLCRSYTHPHPAAMPPPSPWEGEGSTGGWYPPLPPPLSRPPVILSHLPRHPERQRRIRFPVLFRNVWGREDGFFGLRPQNDRGESLRATGAGAAISRPPHRYRTAFLCGARRPRRAKPRYKVLSVLREERPPAGPFLNDQKGAKESVKEGDCRRPKIRSPLFPPGGEKSVRSLVSPLPNTTHSVGLVLGTRPDTHPT